jgi:hypothetical protein
MNGSSFLLFPENLKHSYPLMADFQEDFSLLFGALSSPRQEKVASTRLQHVPLIKVKGIVSGGRWVKITGFPGAKRTRE